LPRCHRLTPEDARKVLGGYFAANGGLGFLISANREVFEGGRNFLGKKEKGESWGAKPIDKTELAKKHAALLEKSSSFQSLLESDGLLCHASNLAYFSYWRTPSQFSLRFDTRFFLAALPANQSPLPASPEVAHSLWLTP